jgi:Ino eighty subunit 2
MRCAQHVGCYLRLTASQKQETINRLLKKQVGRNKSGSKKPGHDTGGTSTPQQHQAVAPVVLPTMFRYVSSIKSGEFVTSYSTPIGQEAKLERVRAVVQYPGPRPPPVTRRLDRQAAMA